ncbi:hypothetical protein E3T55_19025 [Cryobacterium frigoriphilum]|uniref:Uncharacterized protein n=1 Tax=Cryobacterium frigoriphilum TaxID=1259150 RepID=A0A4V3IQE2_9MICO|nr:hypothetical protein [Cryobacterium frigoriphilum]TFD45122.1 hypothetical protein E3T55_19025 [Cryobacterium frigoriphilum]
MSAGIRKWLAVGVAFGGGVVIAIALVMFGLGATNTLAPPSQQAVGSAPPWTPMPPTPGTTASSAETSTAPSVAERQPGTPKYADDVDPAAIFDVNTMQNYELPADMPAEEQARAHSGMQTHSITALCMQEAGFAYTYIPYWAHNSATDGYPAPWFSDLSESEQAGARLALYGDTGGGADYHWDDAGCWGYAVHTMGNDDAH